MQDIVVPYNYFKPRPYQEEVFRAVEQGYKKILLCWARQMGKDTTTFCALIMKAIQEPGNYFYVFPTKEDARRAVWEKIDHDGKQLVSVIPKDLVIRWSDQEMSFKITANGGISTLRMIGLDHKPDSIRGITPRGIAFSEFAYQDPRAYKIVMPAIRNNPHCLVIYNSTPNGKDHFYNMWHNNRYSKDWFVSTKQMLYPEEPTYVGGILEVDEILSIQREEGLADEEIAREFGCSFDIGAQGAVYADAIELARKEGRIGSFDYDPTRPVDTLLDIGYADATAIWFRQIVGNREIFIDYWEGSMKDAHFIVKDVLEQKGYTYRTHYLPHDASAHKAFTHYTPEDLLTEALKDSGMRSPGHVQVCDKYPIIEGIRGVRKRFGNYFFNEGLTSEGLERIDRYHYRFDPKKRVFTKEPVHDENSHAADALRVDAGTMEAIHISSPKKFAQIEVLGEWDVFNE